MPIPSHLSRLAGPTLRVQPDSRLVELIREGHERAFEEVVRRYRGPLTGFAAGIVPEHRAEDIVQESLAKALEAMRGDSRELALKAWLYTIVRNRALNSLRDEPIHEEISPQHDGVPQPPDIAARRADVAFLVAGIKGLPEQQRQAIVQRELEGRGHEQIAGNLGVTPGAVRQLIFRARTNLREGFGALIPLPVVRQILDAAAVRSSSIEAAVAGGGGVAAIKVAVALLATGAAVGGGAVAVHHGRNGISDPIAPATADASPARHHDATRTTPPSPSVSEDKAASPGSKGQSHHGPRSSTRDGADNHSSNAHQVASSTPNADSGPGSETDGDHGSSHEAGDDSGSHSGSGSGSENEGEGGSDDSGGDSPEGGSGSGHSGSGHGGGDSSGPGGGTESPGSGSGGDDGTSGGDDGTSDGGDGDPVDGDPVGGDSGESSGHGHGDGTGGLDGPEDDSGD